MRTPSATGDHPPQPVPPDSGRAFGADTPERERERTSRMARAGAWIAAPGNRWHLVFAVAAVATLAGLWWWNSGGGNREIAGADSTVGSIPTLDATPGGDIQRESPQYRETLQDANDQGLAEARSAGESFLPTLEEPPAPLPAPGTEAVAADATPPLPEIPEDDSTVVAVETRSSGATPRPATDGLAAGATDTVLEVPQAQARTPQAVPATATETGDTFLLQPLPPDPPAPEAAPARFDAGAQPQPFPVQPGNPAMRAMMEAIVAGSFQWQPEARNLDRERPAQPVAVAAPGPATGQGTQAGSAVPPIATGSLLTARMITAADSDLGSGPALAEIVSEPHVGTRIAGRWEAAAEGIVVTFDTAVAPAQPPEAITAQGIALDTTSTQLSDVRESRVLARYGPAFLLGALASAATSASDPRCREVATYTSDGRVVSTQVSCDRPSRESEALYGGIAAGIGAVTADVVANTPRGPRWLLNAETVIGVIVISGTDRVRPDPVATGTPGGTAPFPANGLPATPFPVGTPVTPLAIAPAAVGAAAGALAQPGVLR